MIGLGAGKKKTQTTTFVKDILNFSWDNVRSSLCSKISMTNVFWNGFSKFRIWQKREQKMENKHKLDENRLLICKKVVINSKMRENNKMPRKRENFFLFYITIHVFFFLASQKRLQKINQFYPSREGNRVQTEYKQKHAT